MNLHRLLVLFVAALTVAFWPTVTVAQIRVNPDGVNINSQGSTVVFLTFGPVPANRVPADGCWCGELIPAPGGGIGFACNPATIFGCLPARNDFSQRSGTGNLGFTDIMSIPPSVARRAYQAALTGVDSRFFYVRRFLSTIGAPDEFVNVTCRMAGTGARTPFSLTDVRLSFAIDKPVLILKGDEQLPSIKAEITYNGTGRLKGRWEVVLPGEEPPSETDLLTEASLPVENRPLQRRYTQLSTFNVFLPPDGRYTLEGPEPSRLPVKVKGEYQILLRIEVTDDKEGDSNLSVVGAGPTVVHSGAVAGFPLPVLRYYVGGGPHDQLAVSNSTALAALAPDDQAIFAPAQAIEFLWADSPRGQLYRLEVQTITDSRLVLSALFPPGAGFYRAPPWLKDKAAGSILRWRIVAVDEKGAVAEETAWRSLKFGQPN
jgi:hypothetical protein